MAYNFKKEEDVKEFLENLAIEYRFGCFHEKKPEVCHLLGDYFEAISQNFKKALTIYKNNCDENNFGHSCFKAGAYYMQGKGLEGYNDNVAMKYFKRGCELGYFPSCYRAGLLHMNSEDERVRDYTQGMAYYEKACNNDIREGCFDLSVLYISGDKEKSIPKDMTKSAYYSKKACELQNMYACANLSRMYKLGDGVEQNIELSNKYKAIATDMQDQINRKEELKFQMGIDPV
ncbi:cytochrome c oxidase assembly factor 7 [Lycorma delicatula]|uniref:cytochrome c oxidase assembly factor 7 n=1 Tax=Lycorma delicatula TaxID=130591 RepID=UPI003F51720A